VCYHLGLGDSRSPCSCSWALCPACSPANWQIASAIFVSSWQAPWSSCLVPYSRVLPHSSPPSWLVERSAASVKGFGLQTSPCKQDCSCPFFFPLAMMFGTDRSQLHQIHLRDRTQRAAGNAGLDAAVHGVVGDLLRLLHLLRLRPYRLTHVMASPIPSDGSHRRHTGCRLLLSSPITSVAALA